MTQEEIIISLMPDARKMCFRYKKRFPWIAEDIDSVAYVGLVKGVKSFDSSKGILLTSWIFTYVTGMVRNFINDDVCKKIHAACNMSYSEIPAIMKEVLIDKRCQPAIVV